MSLKKGPLALPGFAAYLTAGFISNLGSFMQIFAESWVVLLLAGGQAARWGGRFSFASGLAMLLFIPVGGWLGDHFNRRKVLMATQAFLALLALVAAALAWQGGLTLPRLLGLAFLGGLATASALPLGHAMLSDLVPQEHLGSAMALGGAQFNLARILGPLAAALSFRALGAAGNFLLNSLSFLWLITVLARLPLRPQTHEDTRNLGMAEAFRGFRSDPVLARILLMATCSGLFAWTYSALLPVYGTRYLGYREGGVAGLLAAFGVGAVAGAMWVLRHPEPAGRRITYGFAGYGAGLLLMALPPPPALAGLPLALMGFCASTYATVMSSQVQKRVAPHLRGRASALYMMAIVGTMAPANLILGELAQILGPRGPLWVLRLDGLVMLGVGLLAIRLADADQNPLVPG
ncbi:MAG TPA: MFS transporter [Holophagaceae bacterium]|nr:MFS transporter [Holophagaceae bacterium]